LRTLISKHGSDIVNLDRLRTGPHLIFEVRPDNRRCAFRAQRDAALPLVKKGIHFLLYNISAFSDASLKKLSMLKNRGPDLSISGIAAYRPYSLLQ
jgi:hypothetical protein